MDGLDRAKKKFKKKRLSVSQGGKFSKVMHEWGKGRLRHGSTGKIVSKGRQDIALTIAYSEARRGKKR